MIITLITTVSKNDLDLFLAHYADNTSIVMFVTEFKISELRILRENNDSYSVEMILVEYIEEDDD